jgi:GxxExxY protein
LLHKSHTTEDTETDGGHGIGLVHAETTRRILAAAYTVHSRLGPGLLERPYRVCMSHEMTRLGVSFEAEKVFPVVYDGITIDLGYRVDFLVEDAVIVEIKAVEAILPVHEAQLLSYLKLGRKRVGLRLLNRLRDLRFPEKRLRVLRGEDCTG